MPKKTCTTVSKDDETNGVHGCIHTCDRPVKHDAVSHHCPDCGNAWLQVA